MQGLQNLSGKVYHLETKLRQNEEQLRENATSAKKATPEKLNDALMTRFQESI